MKILVLSNNPLNLNNANGRSISNMLGCFSKDEIFGISFNGNFSNGINSKNYKIYENKLINPFSKKYGAYVTTNSEIIQQNSRKIKKTPFICLMRSFLWNHNRRLYKEIKNEVMNYSPDCIFVQCGDNDFLIKIAINLSKELNRPLFAYITEDYIFKKWNYLEPSKRETYLFKKFQKKLMYQYDHLFLDIKEAIYLTPALKTIYLEKYPHHSAIVIYTSSNLTYKKVNKKTSDIVYLGNLNVGRDEMLISLSKIFYKHFNKRINVYSANMDYKIIEKLKQSGTINYCGAVSYDECISILRHCFFCVCVESLDEFYQKDTKNAFSTKIADCIALRIPIVGLFPKASFTCDYFKKYDCGFCFNSFEDVEEFATKYSKKHLSLDSKSKNQRLVYNLNHDAKNNSLIFFNAINAAVNKAQCTTLDCLITTYNYSRKEILEMLKGMNIFTHTIVRNQCNLSFSYKLNINGIEVDVIFANDKGLSKNRNELLKLSNSDYIIFCDDDLVFKENAKESIAQLIASEDADCFVFNVAGENVGQRKIKTFSSKKNNKKASFHNVKSSGVWRLLIKRQLIQNVTFNEKIGAGTDFLCGEDTLFLFDVFQKKYAKIIITSTYLCEIQSKTSSWFYKKDNNDNYLYVKGYVYRILYCRFFFLVIIRFLIKERKFSFSNLRKCIYGYSIIKNAQGDNL